MTEQPAAHACSREQVLMCARAVALPHAEQKITRLFPLVADVEAMPEASTVHMSSCCDFCYRHFNC